MRTATRRFLVLGLALPVGLVVAEVGFRVYAKSRMPEYTSAAILARSYDADAADPEAEYGVILHPYLGFVERPGGTLRALIGDERLARMVGPDAAPEWLDRPANQVGFVTPQDLPFEKAEDELLVVVLGGSVARWFALQGGPLLAESMEADPRLEGRTVSLFNAATPGHKQPQTLFALQYLVALGLEPNVVVEIGGLNEATITAGNAAQGVAVAYPHHTMWAHVYGGGAPSESMLALAVDVATARREREVYAAKARSCAGVSNALAFLFARRAEAAHVRSTEAANEYLRTAVEASSDQVGFTGPTQPDEHMVFDARALEIWMRGVRMTDAVCRDLGIAYVHALHPAAHDVLPEPSKPLTDEERAVIGAPDSIDAMAVGIVYPQLRERIPELVAMGADVRDLTQLFADVTDPLYYDPGHFDQRGNELLAEALAPHLLDALAP